MVKIITDSCCDLSPQLIRDFNIDVIPMEVFIDETNYKDGINLSTLELFDSVKKTGLLPKTAAPSLAEFYNHFQVSGEIVFISVSSQLSACYQNASLVQENIQRDDIHIIDSKNLSTGIGLLVLRAAELAQQGASAAEIETKIKQLIPKVRTSFVIDTLEYIYKGGRVSAIEMVMGGILRIRPVIEVKNDGTLGIKHKVNGSRKKALQSLVQDFAKNSDLIDSRRVFITHTLLDEKELEAHYLESEIRKLLNIDDVSITKAGATIASHCGPDTIGILYLQK